MKRKFLIMMPFILLILSNFSGCVKDGNKNEVPCEGSFITFDYAPVDLGENLGHIKPMGLIDFMFFIPCKFTVCASFCIS